MPIRFRCPECRQSYSIAESKAGASLKCQKCGTKMTVPAADAASETTESVDEKRGEAAHQKAFNSLFDDDDSPAKPSAKEAVKADSKASADSRKDDANKKSESVAATSRLEESSDEKHSSSRGGSAAKDVASVEATSASVVGAGFFLPEEESDEDGDEEENKGFGTGRSATDGEMDLTPMVDVVFQLLIFFMVTASFAIQKSQEVPAPEPDEKGAASAITQPEELQEESVMVNIDSRNVISIDDEPLSDPSRLEDVLRSKRKSEILITLHENAMHEMMVRVIDAANDIGMQKIRVGMTRGAE